jgi:hypothetical protein
MEHRAPWGRDWSSLSTNRDSCRVYDGDSSPTALKRNSDPILKSEAWIRTGTWLSFDDKAAIVCCRGVAANLEPGGVESQAHLVRRMCAAQLYNDYRAIGRPRRSRRLGNAHNRRRRANRDCAVWREACRSQAFRSSRIVQTRSVELCGRSDPVSAESEAGKCRSHVDRS